MLNNIKCIGALGMGLLVPFLSYSQTSRSEIDSGDTAWVLMATAMVMLMTPAGLALFYGGLTKSKNVLNTIGMSYVAFCVAFLAWVILGYSLAFSNGGPFLGDFDNVLLKNITISNLKGTVPTYIFVAFQGTFAAIAVAIVSGSIIERVKFSTWCLFTLVWTLFIYCPIAHWIWGGGFLSQNGELDFAGGTVIHINAGIAGLVVSYMLGKRKGYSSQQKRPFSVNLTVLGSALLWFGWFGFNAGSQLAADHIAANAFLVTNLAACAGGISWLFIELYDKKKPSLIGLSSGVISGLVAITPAAGYVDVSGSLCIGLLGGIVGYLGSVKLKKLIGYDDSLDVFGIHGLVGILGAILTGVFANPDINNASGLIYGNYWQVFIQLKAVIIIVLFTGFGTAILFKLSSLITNGARVHPGIEKKGLDKMIHGEKGFDLQGEFIDNTLRKN